MSKLERPESVHVNMLGPSSITNNLKTGKSVSKQMKSTYSDSEGSSDVIFSKWLRVIRKNVWTIGIFTSFHETLQARNYSINLVDTTILKPVLVPYRKLSLVSSPLFYKWAVKEPRCAGLIQGGLQILGKLLSRIQYPENQCTKRNNLYSFVIQN